MQYTQNLNLELPEGNDKEKRSVINGNSVKIDVVVGDLQKSVTENAASITQLLANQLLCAAPEQDGAVEGAWQKFAEYTFPQTANFESSEVTFQIRNRVTAATTEDGILRVRLRYGKAAAAFQYAQIYWIVNRNIDASKFVMCCNAASGKVELYVNNPTAYTGYVCKVTDMGTSASKIDYTSWALYSPTSGQTDLPSEADGWASVVSEV